MIYKIETKETVETIKETMEERAKTAGFGLLKSYEFTKILHDKGFPIEKDITVFELCNPQGAQQALSNIAEISVYLPCRISLYEEEGHTVLATIGLDEIIEAVTVNDDFKVYMNILFTNLKKVMHSWDK